MTVACLCCPQDPQFLQRTTPMRRMLLGYQPDMEMPGGGYSNAKHAFHGVGTAASKLANDGLAGLSLHVPMALWGAGGGADGVPGAAAGRAGCGAEGQALISRNAANLVKGSWS